MIFPLEIIDVRSFLPKCSPRFLPPYVFFVYLHTNCTIVEDPHTNFTGGSDDDPEASTSSSAVQQVSCMSLRLDGFDLGYVLPAALCDPKVVLGSG